MSRPRFDAESAGRFRYLRSDWGERDTDGEVLANEPAGASDSADGERLSDAEAAGRAVSVLRDLAG